MIKFLPCNMLLLSTPFPTLFLFPSVHFLVLSPRSVLTWRWSIACLSSWSSLQRSPWCSPPNPSHVRGSCLRSQNTTTKLQHLTHWIVITCIYCVSGSSTRVRYLRARAHLSIPIGLNSIWHINIQ